MARYRFHNLVLDVEPELERRANLGDLLAGSVVAPHDGSAR